MLLGPLGASLLGNMLLGKKNMYIYIYIYIYIAGEGIIRAGYGSGFLMSPHPLTNFEIQKYYQNNGIYSRDNLTN